MIVKDLIKQLKEMPKDAHVFTVYDTGHSYPEVTGVVLEQRAIIINKETYRIPVVIVTDTNGKPGKTYVTDYVYYRLEE